MIGFLWRPSCAPGQLLNQFLERSHAPWQCDEGVRAPRTSPVCAPCMSGVITRSCTRSSMCSRLTKEVRNDAGNRSAVVEDRYSASAPISPTEPAAINEPDIVLGENAAKLRPPPP